MDNADSIPESAWTALDTVMAVPLWMWAVGGAIGLFGIILLVFLFASVSLERRKNRDSALKSMCSIDSRKY